MNTSLSPAEKISAAIAAAPGKTAIVAFLTAGYPNREKFREHLAQIGDAADVVEIGVPFTDPMADGVTIQRSSREALNQGFTLRWLLEELSTMRRPKAPLILMSYLNPLMAYGFSQLASDAAKAGVCGFIVPDLPYDEGEDFRAALAPAGLALIQTVTPVTKPERMARLCAASQGFVYAVTMTGTTGHTASVPGEYLPDLENAGCILYWGYNPSVARLAHATSTVAALARGAKLIVVDPRKAGLAAKADHWLRVRPGTDGALALSLMHVMIENGWYDASAVMIRRLIETLIIEVFEKHGIASKIQNSSGDFLFLKDLISTLLSEKAWNLSRNARAALPRLKDVGDMSAHSRRFIAQRQDIDKLISDLRVIVQELVTLAHLK